ncbi:MULTISPECIES: type VI secretion system baseplate subunit TssE [Pantoea]|uniref:Type VI secretion system baseplate subunit TssE n=1 Tax=Candidatus Pantoea multigeneris TaxID=2608357 RepID=A0ABX0R549_9GAMM|nr:MULTISPECIES: type VI secretion system baseplate subunit TssE [Pantoea]NIF20217.1 type VI secretion system baseplate subunit TssE [Pantoea multigeneris]
MHKPQDSLELLYGGVRQRKKRETVTARDRLQPSLLDRLTDDAPHLSEESAGQQAISHTTLRRNVLRDLQWLFNTINLNGQQDLDEWPQVEKSVLNFGVAPLAGRSVSEINWSDMQNNLTQAIVRFEPRIMPEGLEVRCVSDTTSLTLHNLVSIEIRGRLWCVPWPLEFLFRSDVDLESGSFDLKDVGVA